VNNYGGAQDVVFRYTCPGGETGLLRLGARAFYAESCIRTSENSSSTQFVNKGKKKAGAALDPDPLRLGSATLKSKVLLYALALTYLLREHL
jgi:hypothetical protein